MSFLNSAAFTALLLSLTLAGTDGRACTTFALKNSQSKIVGKSYDWHTAVGFAMNNPRNHAKQALVLPGQAKTTTPLKWISKYGSLTFNQYGRGFPNSGINEKGLVAEVMWLESAQYPSANDKRPMINELQWIQYQLDNFATVGEVLKSMNKVRISPIHGKVHYLLCDPTGACATIEYLGGKLVSHSGDSLETPNLTNSPYSQSMTFLKKQKDFGGKSTKPTASEESLDRFVRISRSIRDFKPSTKDPVKYSFAALDNVRMKTSLWQIIYESAQKRVHFRFAGEKTHSTIDLKNLNFKCDAKLLAMDLNGELTGKKRKFVSYNGKLNYSLLKSSLSKLKSDAFNEQVIQGLAAFPDATSKACAE